MGLFKKTVKQTDVETLQEKSKNIVSVFTKTIEELKIVNQEIADVRQQKMELISQLRKEAGELDTQLGTNIIIIEKVERLLS